MVTGEPKSEAVAEFAPEWRMGHYEWLPEQDHLVWSPQLVGIYGLDRAPKAEQGFTQLVHPDDRLRVEGETSAYLSGDATSYSHKFRIVRPDGEVRVVLDRAVIERDAQGQVRRIYGVNVDITDEADLNDQAEERLDQSEGRFRTLFEAIDEGFCLLEVDVTAPGGRIDYRVVEANPAFYTRTGFPESILGKWLREAAPALEEHWYEIYGRVAQTGEPVRFEQSSDMLGRWFEVYAFPFGHQSSRHVGVLFNDISERRRNAEHAQLLMREVNHRSKNLLAVVQAIARQTAPPEAREFLIRLEQRLDALSAEQDILIQNAWKIVPIHDLVESQLAHFKDLIGDRIHLSGPSVSLRPDAAQTLGMALHELATNAAKYGALSDENGRIQIFWRLDRGGSPDPLFALSWTERDGPQVAPPNTKGFGSMVTTRMVEHGCKGEVTVDFPPEGFTWLLKCPAPRVLDPESI